MTKKGHVETHKRLHKSLEELVADYITCTGKHLSDSTIMDLMSWSAKQTVLPDIPAGLAYEEETK
jgi:hypothetical protein